MTTKLIILDRDGVINYDSDDYIKSEEEWTPLPGSIEAISKLHQSGFRIAIATNQSGLARNYFDNDTLEAMHHKMVSLIEAAGGKIDLIAFCPHKPGDNCSCRKPLPGLITKISEQLSIPISQSVIFVGDSMSDLEAGYAAGCTPVLVKTGKGMKSFVKLKEANNSHLKDIAVYNSLSEFVENHLQ